jgi:hypothetical protein
MFAAESPLAIPELSAKLRPFGVAEADRLHDLVLRGNVFARHSRHDNFYLRRIEALAGRTIIEVTRPGEPDDVIEQAQQVAATVESVLLLCASLCLKRPHIQSRLAITTHRRTTFDLTIGPECYHLRSRLRPETEVRGLTLDERTRRRFERCGFPALASLCVAGLRISPRASAAVHWLAESRQEPLLTAAVVKTAIALETLLLFNDTEPLAKSLSERSAFILSCDPTARLEISKIVRRFYEARSRVVHGSRRQGTEDLAALLEGLDRLTTLLCLVLAANRDKWPSHESVREWCEGQRWGPPATDIAVPFPGLYLTRALALCQRSNV